MATFATQSPLATLAQFVLKFLVSAIVVRPNTSPVSHSHFCHVAWMEPHDRFAGLVEVEL